MSPGRHKKYVHKIWHISGEQVLMQAGITSGFKLLASSNQANQPGSMLVEKHALLQCKP
jgi:hypothetical protein